MNKNTHQPSPSKDSMRAHPRLQDAFDRRRISIAKAWAANDRPITLQIVHRLFSGMTVSEAQEWMDGVLADRADRVSDEDLAR